ncbi:MAG: aldehyde dehydrogenase family protein [Saprospiraceae bacterium]
MPELAVAPAPIPSVSPATAGIEQLFQAQLRHQFTVARSTARERIGKLQRLHDALLQHRDEIRRALQADFHKSVYETDITEIGVVNSEIRHAIRHLKGWMRPRHIGTPLALIGSSSRVRYEPKGVCLILSPWNFPFNLTFAPLVSAIAAGNCVVLKPSEFTPHSSAVMKKIVAELFPPEEITLVEGDATVAQALTSLPFHHIFFTGSPAVGKLVMAAAAKNLASVTLELGGKSPVVVDESADLDNAAAKIAWLKCMNAGQICIAPDYLLVQENVHDALVEKIKQQIGKFLGESPEARQATPDYSRIVNRNHFDRVQALLEDAVKQGGRVALGGPSDRNDRFIDPTVLVQVPAAARIWQEEIFGPLLPVQDFKTLDDALAIINAKPKSLAMYLFSRNKRNINYLLTETRNGGVSVNDCGVHFFNAGLPFGGANNSGIGKCHGEYGFQEFSNARGVLYQSRWLPSSDFLLPPYGSRVFKFLVEAIVKWL